MCIRDRGRKSSASGINPWALYHECRQQCNSGEEITSETAYINFTGEAAAAYKHYTASVATRNTAHKSKHIGDQTSPIYDTPTAAWTFSDTQEALDANTISTQTSALAENPLFQPNSPGGINYIQLDTASESELGSFTQNLETSLLQNREEMRAIASEIRSKGFKAGIRFNPFCAALNSELVKNHPDLSLIHI